MHIEPGVVDAAKMSLSYGTAAVAISLVTKESWKTVKTDGAASLATRGFLATLCVFFFFEVLPTFPVGVSEVHFILGSTLFLLFGAAPAAIGLALGLLAQGLLFAPADLPQYAINITTLLVPLFAMAMLARRMIPKNTAYVDITYSQALRLSLVYQGGIISWVAFWAFYGQGFGAENLAAIGSFGIAYLSVVLLEPVLDLAVLFIAKSQSRLSGSALVTKRLYNR